MSDLKRVLFVTPIISPLHTELLAKIHHRGNVSLSVVYLNEREEERHWKEDPAAMQFSYSILSRRTRSRTGKIRGWRFDKLLRHIAHQRPDVVVFDNWSEFEIFIAICVTRLLGIPQVQRCGSTLTDKRPQSVLIDMIKRFVFKGYESSIVAGPAQAKYLAHFGVPETQMFEAPYMVPGKQYRDSARESSVSLAGDPALLFVGRLNPVKRVDLLIDAMDHISDKAHLHIIGDGNLEEELRAQAAEGAKKRIHFHNFVDRTKLGAYYASADALLLPSSSEPWGLVVNEAMEVGCPVIVSDHVGCAPTLVVPGKTGAVFRNGDLLDLVRAINMIACDLEVRKDIRGKVKEHIRHFDYDLSASGWESAINYACEKRTNQS